VTTTRRPFEVAVVVRRPARDGPEYLVLLRSPEQQGYWHLVAGGVEWDEEPDVAAARELEEEVGLVSSVVDLDLVLGYALADEPAVVRDRFAPEVERVDVRMYAVSAPATWEPVLDAEHVEHRWLPVDEAVELLFWPEPKEALRRAHEVLG
jgi:8-oxo-dGTP pyrophosphatase MutT (NUDIX family)